MLVLAIPAGLHSMVQTLAGIVLEELQPTHRTDTGTTCDGVEQKKSVKKEQQISIMK